jgi:ABC-type phosphate/phosphonate transport system ATPase subunit
MQQGPETIIHATSISKAYVDGAIGLRNVDLQVRRGELVGLLGRSGAGKTTLLRLLNGMRGSHHGVLRGVRMSTGSELSEVMAGIRCAGFSVGAVETTFDADEEADLGYLRVLAEERNDLPATRAVLESLGPIRWKSASPTMTTALATGGSGG